MRKRILYKLNSITITLIFSIAIFVPFFIGIIEKDKEISAIEKRKLSTFPKVMGEINDIKKFPKLFDTYYSDHFGLRDWFVKYYKLVKFNIGDSPSNDVTIGKDGWLFLGSIRKGYNRYSDPIGDVRNVNLFSKSDLKKFATYMASLKAWLNSKGIEYVFVIAPNKHTIYFDKLPDYLTKINKYSATDQLVEYMKSHTDVPIVDLRKILIESKNKHQLYYKTDTHWNHYAANIAQYEIMLEIEKLFPKLIHPETVKLKEGVRGGGDLANFIGVHDFDELNPQPVFENSCKPIKHPNGAKGRETHSFICEGQKLNALIFRDSFFSALEPYFSRKFKRSTYIWEKLNYSSLRKYIKSENPDVVIEEWVERSLPLLPNAIPEFNHSFNKKLFKCSDKPIFLCDFRRLKYNKHIKITENVNESMKLKSIGKDPIITFPPLPLVRGYQYVVHIEAKSSVDSMLQLFYSDSEVAGYPFSEQNSVRIGINSGYNDIYILLDYDKLGKRLRLDPISGIGEIELKTIEIREIENQLTKTCTRTK
jgi:hypothetical protein